jgi:hypothetical protein
MGVENNGKSDNKNDDRFSSICFPSHFNRRNISRYARVMAAIVLAALQILLLLLKAHFNRNEDQERAIASIKEAQAKLDELASSFEIKLRYSSPSKEEVDRVQDLLDRDRKCHESSPHK